MADDRAEEQVVPDDPLGLGGTPDPDAPSRRPRPRVISLLGEFFRMSRTTAILLAVFVVVGALYLVVRAEPVFQVGTPGPAEPTGTAPATPTDEVADEDEADGSDETTDPGSPTGTTSSSTPGAPPVDDDDETTAPSPRDGASEALTSVPEEPGAGGAAPTGAGSPDTGQGAGGEAGGAGDDATASDAE